MPAPKIERPDYFTLDYYNQLRKTKVDTAIADEHFISHVILTRWKRELGLKIKRGGVNRKLPSDEKVLELKNSGVSIAEITRKYNCSRFVVYCALKRIGE